MAKILQTGVGASLGGEVRTEVGASLGGEAAQVRQAQLAALVGVGVEDRRCGDPSTVAVVGGGSGDDERAAAHRPVVGGGIGDSGRFGRLRPGAVLGA